MARTNISVESIINTLASCESSRAKLSFDQQYIDSKNIFINPNPPDFYVEPDFSIVNNDILNASFALISAPAAVGKTTFSKYLHQKITETGRQVVYIPLKDATIGDDYFIGTLTSVYDTAAKSDIIERICFGEIILIFDGYDEVSMTTDQIARNIRFIENIKCTIDLAKKGDGVVILFLFRSVFYDFDIFSKISDKSLQINLEFFNKQKRISFLQTYLEKKHNKPNSAIAARDLLIALESRLDIAQHSNADSFFGHAIVLQAFGDYIADEDKNIQNLINKISAEGVDEKTSIRIFDEIIKSILIREESKFNTRIFESASSSVTPYKRELQEELLTALAEDYIFNKNANIKLKELIREQASQFINNDANFSADHPHVKQALIESYVEELESKIQLHPFIDKTTATIKFFKNPIYFEYYLAKLCHKKNIGMDDLFSIYKKPSYFFAMFFLSFTKDRSVNNYENALYHLSNLYLSSITNIDATIQMNFDEAKKYWIINFSSESKIQDFYYQDELLTITVPSGGAFHNFFINGKVCLVSIEGGSKDYHNETKIADGKIVCDSLELNGSKFTFDKFIVNCNDLTFSPSISYIKGGDSLSIGNAKCSIQMSDSLRKQCSSDFDIATDPPQISVDILIKKIQRMVLYFRRHGRSEFACYFEKFENWILNNDLDTVSTKIATIFMDERIIYKMDRLMVLDQAKLTEFGISYGKQNEINVSPEGRKRLSQIKIS